MSSTRHDEWVTSRFMLAEYEISKDTLAGLRFRPETRYLTKKVGGSTHVHLGELKRLQKQRNKIWNANHEYYYHIQLEMGLSDHEQAELLVLAFPDVSSLASWRQYLSRGMWFGIYDKSILFVQPRVLDVAYCEFAEAVVRRSK